MTWRASVRRFRPVCRWVFGLASVSFCIAAVEGAPPKKPSAPTVRSVLPPAEKPQTPKGSKKTPLPAEGLPNETLIPDAIEEPAEEAGPASEDYAPDDPWLRTAKFVEYVQFTSAVRAMLMTDWQESKNAARHAQSHFDTARKLHGDDPRLYYAYGLLLWKNQEREPGIAQFETAAKTGKNKFLPALQAAAWCRIWQRDVNRGGVHLVTLAKTLAEPTGEHPSAEQKKRAADWLGQTVGYLSGAGRTPANTDAVVRLEQTIDSLISGPSQNAYERGRTKSRGLFTELEAIAARPDSDLRRELRSRRQLLLDDLGAVQPDLEAARAAAKLNRDTVAAAEGKFRLAAQKLNSGNAELTNLPVLVENLSIPRFRTETKEVRVFVKDKTEKGDKGGKRDKDEANGSWQSRIVTNVIPETPGEQAARLAQRQQAVDRYNALLASLPQLTADLTQSRVEMVGTRREMQREHRALYARLIEFNDEEHRLKTSIRQHEEWEQSPARFKEHIRSLPPYVPWSMDDDKQRILDSYPKRVPVK